MTVGELRKALKGVSDYAEVVVEDDDGSWMAYAIGTAEEIVSPETGCLFPAFIIYTDQKGQEL